MGAPLSAGPARLLLARGQGGHALGLLGGVRLVQLVELGHAERLLQVVERALRFCSLLIQQIIEDILVALDQSLRVLLSVLQLLVSVALDPFQEGC